jgi:isopentenyldiphosphate isomerase
MAKAEWVDLVDRDNQVVGRALRQQVRQENLLHRGIAVLVRNSLGQVYVHQRTASKDLFPAMYDMFVGGVVGSGEDYREAALREAREELGVANDQLEFLFDHLYQGPLNYSWVRCYQVTWDGPIVHQPEEVQWGDWMDESQLPAWVEQVPIVPDGLEIYEAYRNHSGAKENVEKVGTHPAQPGEHGAGAPPQGGAA